MKCSRENYRRTGKGKDVAYLTLGDPTIYSTYMYIHRIVKAKGYETTIISEFRPFVLQRREWMTVLLTGQKNFM